MMKSHLRVATSMSINTEKNLLAHAVYPFAVLLLLSIFITSFNIDERIADYFYAMQGGTWAWKNHWLTEQFFHKGGRNLSIGLAILCTIFLIVAHYKKNYAHCRKPLLYIVLAVIGSSLIVSLFKASLSVSCPWEFARYGGTLRYHTVIEQIFLRDGSGCFPAGQASAGYSWIALYFLGFYYQSSWRWAGLAFAVTTGIILGGAQQIRGAHFMSHDLWTLGLCWFFSLGFYCFMFKKQSFKFAWAWPKFFQAS